MWLVWSRNLRSRTPVVKHRQLHCRADPAPADVGRVGRAPAPERYLGEAPRVGSGAVPSDRARRSVARHRLVRDRPRRARVAVQRDRAARAASTRTPRTPGSRSASTSRSSPSLGPRQRARLLERLGPGGPGGRVGLALAAPQPRARAGAPPIARLAAALRIERPRVPTRAQALGQGAAAPGQAAPVGAQAGPGPTGPGRVVAVDSVRDVALFAAGLVLVVPGARLRAADVRAPARRRWCA